ncbi:hypothetical protein GCM10018966_079560 [Streptomyces yanii]
MVAGVPQGVQEQVTGFSHGAARRAVQQAEEGVEAVVDGMVARFDQAVGVEDQIVAGTEIDRAAVEGDAADTQRRAGVQVEQFGWSPGADQDGGACARAFGECGTRRDGGRTRRRGRWRCSAPGRW